MADNHEVREYRDPVTGNLWQLNARDAKRLGYELVEDKAIRAGSGGVENKAAGGSRSRSRAKTTGNTGNTGNTGDTGDTATQ